MNGYICTWLHSTEKVEIYTDKGAWDAVKKAAVEFQKKTRKKVKTGDVRAWLAEKDGEPVIHSPAEL